MDHDRLRRWLVRSIAGATEVRLLHRGSDDAPRLVRTYPLHDGGGSELLAEIARDIVADAQDETDLAEVRCSFVIQTVGDAGKEINSTKHRAEPIDRDGIVQQNAPHEPSKDGVLAMLMAQNARMHQELAAAPSRMRATYEEIIRIQAADNKALREQVAALTALLQKNGTEDGELAEALRVDAEQREASMNAFMQTAVQLLGRMTGVHIPTEPTQPEEPTEPH